MFYKKIIKNYNEEKNKEAEIESIEFITKKLKKKEGQ
jgi:hypothetical protein